METYAGTGNLHAAAKAARISLATHYRMLEGDGGYRKAFEAAQQQVIGFLEDEAFRRALAGSDELLIFLLRAWLPERYREHTLVKHSGAVVLSEPETSSARRAVARLIAIPKEQVQ
jgi:hypothetical protein